MEDKLAYICRYKTIVLMSSVHLTSYPVELKISNNNNKANKAISCTYSQAIADGDEEYITDLLNKAAGLCDADYSIINFLKISNEDGYNMLHAAIFCKATNIVDMILEYSNRKL